MGELVDLFLTFMRIGGLTFGGGYAMLPMLQAEVVENKKWATEEELLNYYAVGQCTPGIIAVNTATFIGYKRKGVLGGCVATLGVVFPSLVIISIIAAFIQNFAHLDVVQHAFAGIRITVAVLMFNTILRLWKTGVKDVIGIVLFLLGFGISAFTGISPIFVVILAIVLGIGANVSGMVQKIKKGGERK
ncbi:chromate transporter [Anaerolentibacter hominis]|uniref:chromate transporter n=1 Tax=Anaerolentibacter hominis TaxID=3079009 RepID=UPI0031B8353C